MFQEKKVTSPLRELRKKKRISARDLGDRVGIPEYTILKLERGEMVPDYKESLRLGAYFDMPWHLIMERCHDYRIKVLL